MTSRRTASAVIAILVGYALWLSLEQRSSAAPERDIGQIGLEEICQRIQAGDPLTFVEEVQRILSESR